MRQFLIFACFLLVLIYFVGELTSTVTGPRYKIPVTVDSRGDGKHTLIFVPREEGNNKVLISGQPKYCCIHAKMIKIEAHLFEV